MQPENHNRPENDPIRICLVDDDQDTLEIAHRVLNGRGRELLAISRPIGSSAEINAFAPHLLILDIKMPAMDGGNLLELYRKTLKKMPRVILFSGIAPAELENIRDQIKADDCAYKGDGFLQLLRKVNFHLFDLGLLKTTLRPG